MNGIHDLGGMHGFGPIEREVDEPVFHHAWEGRVRAMMGIAIARGCFNLDEFRYGIEQMAPVDYLSTSYYEKWLTAVEYNLIHKGIVTERELEERAGQVREHPDAAVTRSEPVAEQVLLTPPPSTLPPVTPRFARGDAVITRNQHPTGHTRLPRYARGKRGVIHLIHGPEVFPDAAAHGRDEPPQVVYSVRFEGRELWGDAAEPGQTLNIDLWESYLEPA
jgi:nitrile hydratase beta subunit